MGFSVMLWGAEKLVPAEYWCPYGSLQNSFILSKTALKPSVNSLFATIADLHVRKLNTFANLHTQLYTRLLFPYDNYAGKKIQRVANNASKMAPQFQCAPK